MIDNTTKSKYLGKPTQCPYCESINILKWNTHVRTLDSFCQVSYRQRIACGICKKEWIEVYELADIIEVEEENDYSTIMTWG